MDSLDFLQMPVKDNVIPLHLFTIGSNDQPHLNRPVGLPYHQIFLATKGKGVFRIFGVGDFELFPGEVIIILKETGHEYFPLTKGWDLSFVGFDGKLANEMLAQLNFKEAKKMSIYHHNIIWGNIEQLWSIAKRNETIVQWRASELIYSLLLELKRLSISNLQQHNENIQNEHIQKTAEFIRTHYAKPLTVSNLSDMAGYSTHHFTRLFKKMYRLTPHQYMVDVRLEKSRFILEQKGDLPISEVSLQVGMEENYFIRLFRKKYGITPGSYRKKYTLDKPYNKYGNTL